MRLSEICLGGVFGFCHLRQCWMLNDRNQKYQVIPGISGYTRSKETWTTWKYPRVNKAPENTQSNIATPLPIPNLPVIWLFFNTQPDQGVINPLSTTDWFKECTEGGGGWGVVPKWTSWWQSVLAASLPIKRHETQDLGSSFQPDSSVTPDKRTFRLETMLTIRTFQLKNCERAWRVWLSHAL